MGATCPIIVKFARRNVKNMVYSLKRKFTKKNFLTTESLTGKRIKCMKKLKVLKEQGKLISYWSYDGEIYYIRADQPHEKCLFKTRDLQELDF